MKIDRVEVYVVAPEVQRFTWCAQLPPQYMTNTVVRIYTDDGLEGVGGVSNYTSHDFERYTAETLRHMIPPLVGRDPLQVEALWRQLQTRVFPLAPQALAAIDVALWDLRGKYQRKPVYRLLGGTNNTIQSYASTPLFDDVATYLRFVEERLAQGFRAFKFHCWCVPDKDRELVQAVRAAFPDTTIAFMLDAENSYDRRSALEMAKLLDDLEFVWLEAPLADSDKDGYRLLTAQVELPIIPAGNWIQDLPSFEHAMQTNCWTRARTDVTLAGGLTPGRCYLKAAEAAGLKCEVLSWGNTLVAAANLHLMLGSDNLCSYFEQAVPYEPYEYGMIDTIRTGSDGRVKVSNRPGLGYQIDWPAMEKATLFKLDTREMKGSAQQVQAPSTASGGPLDHWA
jgi:L-alanine-DL-glutamate epimerase-like enolase superfamily enzyme